MSSNQFVICHTEHEIDVTGPNAGAEMATRHLARFLAKAGHKISVVGVIKGGDQFQDGVQYIDVGSEYNVRAGLQKISDQGPYHLITAGRAIPIFIAQADPNCLSKILITHDRAGNDTGIKPKVLCKNVDKVVCVSNAQRQVFLEAGADPSNTVTIHNGVDLDIFKANGAENRDLKKLVFAGALIQDKGIQVLIPVFARLRAKFPDVTLDVYGSASLWGREAMFDERQVEQNIPGIKFHGKVPQDVISEAFQGAGICVIPSIWFDPFPLTALEAQVTGCPAVAFDVGGLREGIRHNETGVMLTDISEEALYNCLDELLSNPERLKQMSDKAIETARGYFNWERVAVEIAQISQKSFSTTEITSKSSIALLTPWNDSSDHALYAHYLTKELPQEDVAILAEENQTGESCIPVWLQNDFSKIPLVCKQLQVKTLHINLPLDSVDLHRLNEAVAEVRSSGIDVLLTLHNSPDNSEDVTKLVKSCSRIVVHSNSTKIEAMFHGATAENVEVLTHPLGSFAKRSQGELQAIRSELNVADNQKLILAFGDTTPENQIEAVIEAQILLKQVSIDSTLLLVGNTDFTNPEVVSYKDKLEQLVVGYNLGHKVQFINRPKVDELEALIAAADLVLITPSTRLHGTSTLCALSLALGSITATSTSPLFSEFRGAVWRITSGYPVSTSAHLLLTELDLQESILEKAEDLQSDKNRSWSSYSKNLYAWDDSTSTVQVETDEQKVVAETTVDQNKATALTEKAEAEVHNQNYQLADSLFEQALERNPNSARAWRGKGANYVAEGKFEQALTCFQKSAELDPTEAKTLCGLGLCHTRLGNYSEAKPLLVKVLQRDLSLESSLIQLLEASYALNDFDDLIEVLYKFVSAYPDSMDMRYCLAAALFKQGNHASSETMLEEILKRIPEHQGAVELLRELEHAKQEKRRSTSSLEMEMSNTLRAKEPTTTSQPMASLDKQEPSKTQK